MAVSWNPWHGCRKISPGCTNCYVYRMDDRHGRNGGEIFRTAAFTLPVRRKRNGAYFIPPGEEVDLCFTSDFLLEDADLWRPEVWKMIRCRQDLSFFFITKRIHRLTECIPADWGKGYPNVAIGCTVENQAMADFRLPLFFRMPVMKKLIICAPLLECIDLTPYLGDWVNLVSAGGESGPQARLCKYEWIKAIRRQCQETNVAFCFRQTGARLVKDGVLYRIPRKDQIGQARKANIDWFPGKEK